MSEGANPRDGQAVLVLGDSGGLAVPAVQVLSPSELVAADLAEQCIAAADRVTSRRRNGTRLVDDALRLLVRAGTGLLLALLFEGAISMIALHENVVDALYFSTRSVATGHTGRRIERRVVQDPLSS